MEERTAVKPIQLRAIEEFRRDRRISIVAGTLVEGSAAICLASRGQVSRKTSKTRTRLIYLFNSARNFLVVLDLR